MPGMISFGLGLNQALEVVQVTTPITAEITPTELDLSASLQTETPLVGAVVVASTSITCTVEEA